MRKIRIGKDIAIRWSIKTNGQTVSLAGRDLKLEIIDYYNKSMNIPFSIEGNVLLFVFYGKEQKKLGVYKLTLWENFGKVGQTVVDACEAFELVPCTCQENEEDCEYGLQSEEICLNGDIATAALNIAIQRKYTALNRISDYLFSIRYESIDYDSAKKYFLTKNPEITPAGCSSLRNGNFFGRQLDWFYNNGAEFVVRTPHIKGRYASIGIAGGISELTAEKVESREYSELYGILPFYMQDGINENGVFCNINVVPTDNGLTSVTVPDIEERDRICTLMLVRYILDNFDNATEAVEYIRDYVALYVPKALQEMGYEAHFMIGDSVSTYILEIVNDKVILNAGVIMTNFFISGIETNADGKVYTPADVSNGNLPSEKNHITPNGSGLERYNLIVENYADADTKEGMRSLLNRLMYSNSYKIETTPAWYSEFVSEKYGITVDTPAESEAMQNYVRICREHFTERDRNNPEVWHTTHSCVYDLQKRKLYIVSQEDTDNEFAENMKEYYSAAEIDELLANMQ